MEVTQDERDQSVEGGRLITPSSAEGRELAKWEQLPTHYAKNPGRPYVYRPFPKMVYKAFRNAEGKVKCLADVPHPNDYSTGEAYQRAVQLADAYNTKCQRIVVSEVEFARAMEDGWREGPVEAEAWVHKRDQEISTAAATRAYDDRGMSEKAQRERSEAEANEEGHLPEVKRKPVQRRRRVLKPTA